MKLHKALAIASVAALTSTGLAACGITSTDCSGSAVLSGSSSSLSSNPCTGSSGSSNPFGSSGSSSPFGSSGSSAPFGSSGSSTPLGSSNPFGSSAPIGPGGSSGGKLNIKVNGDNKLGSSSDAKSTTSPEAGSKKAVAPTKAVTVADPSNLSQEERQAIVSAVVMANPGLERSLVTVSATGEVTVAPGRIYGAMSFPASEILDQGNNSSKESSTPSEPTPTSSTKTSDPAEPTPTSATNTSEPTPTSTTNTSEPTPTSATNTSEPTPTSATNTSEPSPTSTTKTSEPAPTSTTKTSEPAPTSTTKTSEPAPTSTAEPTPTKTAEPEAPADPKEKALQRARETIERAKRLDKAGPSFLPPTYFIDLANQRLKSILDHPERFSQSGIDSVVNQVNQMFDQIATAYKIPEDSGKTSREIRVEEIEKKIAKAKEDSKDWRRGVALTNMLNELKKAQDAIDNEANGDFELATAERNLGIGVQRSKEQYAQQQQDEKKMKDEREAAEKKWKELPVVKYATDDGELNVSNDTIIKYARALRDTIPKLKTMDHDPYFDQFPTVEEIMGKDTDPAAYDAAWKRAHEIQDIINAEFEEGKGDDFYDKNKDTWIQYVATEEDAELLKPLIKLADAYNKVMAAKYNEFRKKLTIEPLATPELTDLQKANMIVHSIAEYQRGRTKDAKGNFRDGHTRTKAVDLVPHAKTNGWNENYYGSYNSPETGQHLTVEFMADAFFREILREADNLAPDKEGEHGHFDNLRDYDARFRYGSPYIGEIIDQANGDTKYRFSMTDFQYKLMNPETS